MRSKARAALTADRAAQCSWLIGARWPPRLPFSHWYVMGLQYLADTPFGHGSRKVKYKRWRHNAERQSRYGKGAGRRKDHNLLLLTPLTKGLITSDASSYSQEWSACFTLRMYLLHSWIVYVLSASCLLSILRATQLIVPSSCTSTSRPRAT